MRDVAIDALLGAAVVVAVLSCAGIQVMRTAMQRLHYLGPLTMIAPVLIGVAVAIARNGYAGAGFKALFIAIVLVVFGPVLAHQTARTVDGRREG